MIPLEEGQGRCDVCGAVHPIGRGQNFTAIEGTDKWQCNRPEGRIQK